MTVYKRYNALAKAVSPALRTRTAGYAYIYPFPRLGSNYRIEFSYRGYTPNADVLNLFGRRPQDTAPNYPYSSLSVRAGSVSGQLVFAIFESIASNTQDGGQVAFNSGYPYQENRFAIVSNGTQITLTTNGGAPVVLSTPAKNVNWEEPLGMVFGQLRRTDASFHNNMVLDNFKVFVADELVIDIDGESGTGQNNANPGTYDMVLMNGAEIYPSPGGVIQEEITDTI